MRNDSIRIIIDKSQQQQREETQEEKKKTPNHWHKDSHCFKCVAGTVVAAAL